jgi:hypothetical protein
MTTEKYHMIPTGHNTEAPKHPTGWACSMQHCRILLEVLIVIDRAMELMAWK